MAERSEDEQRFRIGAVACVRHDQFRGADGRGLVPVAVDVLNVGADEIEAVRRVNSAALLLG